MILNLDDAPTDPLERIMWLTGVDAAVKRELDQEYADAYFQTRLRGQLDAAVAAGPHSRKRVLAYTRAQNERNGRTIRWGDRADPTSTTYAAGGGDPEHR